MNKKYWILIAIIVVIIVLYFVFKKPKEKTITIEEINNQRAVHCRDGFHYNQFTNKCEEDSAN